MGSRGVLRVLEGGLVAFWCPGCCEYHQVRVEYGRGRVWGFNGNYDRPSFSPSILVRTGHYVPGMTRYECSCRSGVKDECRICHSYVTDGQIQFLDDCTHHLAGRTIPLLAAPETEDV